MNFTDECEHEYEDYKYEWTGAINMLVEKCKKCGHLFYND